MGQVADGAAPARQQCRRTRFAGGLRGASKGYEVDQCARCHAQQETLGVGSQPGKSLVDSAYPTLLTPGAYHADGQQQAEVFEYGSFVQSKMYAAGVTCSDCHNPHTGELPAQGNQLCASCHNPQATRGSPR